MRQAAKKTAYGGVLAACALMFSYIEYLMPISIGVPGIKLGLANLVVIVALYWLGVGNAFAVNIVRIVFSSLLFSGLVSMFFGLAGGMLSLFAMALLKRTGAFSVVGVSIAGGAVHNIGQILVAAAFISNFAVFYYLPALLMSGALTGLLIGVLARSALDKITLSFSAPD